MKRIAKKLLVTVVVIVLLTISSSQAVTYAYKIYLHTTREDNNTYTFYNEKTKKTVVVYDYALNNDSRKDYYCLKGNVVVSDSGQSYGTYNTKTSIMNTANLDTLKNNGISFRTNFSFMNNSNYKIKTEEESLKALQWLVKNMYMVSTNTTDDQKSIMKSHLNKIINRFCGKAYKNYKTDEFDEEFIGVIQQFVVWQFVNPASNSDFYQNSITGWKSMGNIEWDGKKTMTDDEKKAAYAMYWSLCVGAIKYAKGQTTFTMETNKSTSYTIKPTSKTVEKIANETNTYKIGPITVTGTNISAIEADMKVSGVSIKSIKFIDKDSGATLKSVQSDNCDVVDLIGESFYIEFVTESEIKSNKYINFNYTVRYGDRLISAEGYAYTQNNKQPILEINKSVGNGRTSKALTFRYEPVDENFDLALTKEIAQIYRYDTTKDGYVRVYDSEKDEKTDKDSDASSDIVYSKRLNNVDISGIEENYTAYYNMNKEPITVYPGDIIRYKITVYNEGNVEGYVSEITDYLPEGLELVQANENSNYGSKNYANSQSGELDYSTYNKSDNIVKLTLSKKSLSQFDGTGQPDSFSEYIECKVTNDVKSEQLLTNVSEITKYGYNKNGVDTEAEENGLDFDSEQNNVFKIDSTNISDVKGYEEYIETKETELQKIDSSISLSNVDKGEIVQQDDEDFEQVKVGKFDLTLRKFITSVTDYKMTTSRVPSVNSVKEYLSTGTAAYRHTKVPINVKIGDTVTYTIRIYNEGDIDGVASEITDYLPEGLEFIQDSTINKENGWTVSTDADGNIIKNADGSTTVKTELLKDTIIPAANGVTGLKNLISGESYFTEEHEDEKFWIDIKIECKISGSNKSNDILTNVAEITNYGYYQVNSDNTGAVVADNKLIFKSAKDNGVDTDSTADNVWDKLTNEKGKTGNTEGYYDYQSDSYNIESYGETYYKGIEDDDDFENVRIQPFDLALRKYITKVGDQNIDGEDSREPEIEEISSSALLVRGTAWYFHTKTPVTVKTKDTVLYTIRVYNEGYDDGYAKEITDYLPEGLEFIEDSTINKENGWTIDKNEDGTVKKNADGSTTIRTEYLANKLIKASNAYEGYEKLANGELSDEDIFWEEVQVECRVTSSTEGIVLTNVSEITNYGYYDEEGNYIEASENDIDQDSEENNVFTKSKLIDNISKYYKYQYTYKGEDREYFAGIQDDDDYENIIVEAKMPYEIVLNKTDEEGNKLNGSYFTITMKEDEQVDDDTIQDDDIVPDEDKIQQSNIDEQSEIEEQSEASEENIILDNKLINGTETIRLEDKTINKEYIYTVTENASADKYINLLGTNKIQIATYIDKDLNLNLGRIDTEENQKEDDEYYTKYGFAIIDSNGNVIKDTNTDLYTKVKVEVNNDVEVPQIIITVQNEKQEFDLALRKFITGVTTGVGTDEEKKLEVPDRVPVFKIDEDGNYVYEHSKEPVIVGNQNVVEYTLRVYNEGSIAGYASEIKDDIPEGLEFLPDDETNKKYGWILLDEEGNVTEDVNKAKYITTNYLSKDNEETEGENLIKAFNTEDYEQGNVTEPDYKEVKVAFKVTMPNTEDNIIINKAQISEDTDEDGNDVTDKDSTPDEWNEGEDDQDIEKVKVQYFDLSLRKWVTKAIVIEDGKETVTETGHTAEDDPEEVVKVDIQKSKLGKVVVKFEYKIRVTNEGEIAGYAKEISDYVPEGLRFEAADNPLWQESEGKITTTQLENKLLKPGETAEVSIILTWINRTDNMGLKENIAEISKDYNEYGSPDIDSTPNNQVTGEDDIDDAPVMLTVKTGQTGIYVGLTMIVLAMLGTGIVMIRKYVLK